MKIVVIGGSGRIGSNIVNRLRAKEHEVIVAAPNTGVNTITGEGLSEALAGAQLVVDVSNSPVFVGSQVLEFFETSSLNILAAEAVAGVKHHVVLSVVGCERLIESEYFQAKVAQENIVKTSSIPYTILRSTQFYEFIEGIINSSVDGATIRLSPALIQPIAANDVSAVLTSLALAAPLNGTVEVAGPDSFPLDELARKFLIAREDDRQVVPDVHARYFGSELNDRSLMPSGRQRNGATTFQTWLKSTSTSS